jgi:UDP-glucuronate 4-epimerase
MNILVTGGAGFIGSHLVEALVNEGHAVTVFDEFNDYYDPAIKRRNVARLSDRVKVVALDIRDKEAVMRECRAGQFRKIIHLAARAGVRPSIAEPELYIETNINGTFHLLEAAKELQVEQFILGSSSSVYGVSKQVPFREDQCLAETISPYAVTKLACEQLCSSYARLYGIRTLCLRFFTVYGPRQRPDLAIHNFTRRIWSGTPIEQFGDGSTGRDYTYVSDIIQGIQGALAYDRTLFEIVNIGGNRVTTLAELIQLIEAALGRKAIIRQLPEQPGDVPLTYADISKANRLLGYDPQTPITEGIPKFVEWFLENESASQQQQVSDFPQAHAHAGAA